MRWVSWPWLSQLLSLTPEPLRSGRRRNSVVLCVARPELRGWNVAESWRVLAGSNEVIVTDEEVLTNAGRDGGGGDVRCGSYDPSSICTSQLLPFLFTLLIKKNKPGGFTATYFWLFYAIRQLHLKKKKEGISLWVIVAAIPREEMMRESDTLAWERVKTGPVEMSILGGVSSKGIQLAGVVCLASRSRSSRSYQADPLSARHSSSLCVLMRALAPKNVPSQLLVVNCVASFPPKRITVAHLHLERRRGMRAPASVAVSHILLNIFFSPFLIFPRVFLNLSNSIIALRSIQKFKSALEWLGLYLKPYHWIHQAKLF